VPRTIRITECAIRVIENMLIATDVASVAGFTPLRHESQVKGVEVRPAEVPEVANCVLLVDSLDNIRRTAGKIIGDSLSSRYGH
jgi:hypothetical protein